MAQANFELTSYEVEKIGQKITENGQYFLEAVQAFLDGSEKLAACWEGPSRETFVTELKKAQERSKQLNALICGYLEQVDKIVILYRDCQDLYGPSMVKSK